MLHHLFTYLDSVYYLPAAGKYDFHWIAIWTDDDGEQKLLEVNWSDIEITG